MPYVLRDDKGRVTGMYAQPIYRSDGAIVTEELPPEHPELVAFFKEQALYHAKETERLQKEHADIRRAAERFHFCFAQIETALSQLFNVMLNLRSRTQLASAIYHSPTSFDARAEIVSNVLVQLILENRTSLADLEPLWEFIKKKINNLRNRRNFLAHGLQQQLVLRGKTHVRFTALAMDVIRLGRPIAKGEIPGLTASDIEKSVDIGWKVVALIDKTHFLFNSFYNDSATLPQRFLELQDCVRDLRNPL